MSDGFVVLFQQAWRAISVTEINNLQLAHGVNVQTHVVESFVGLPEYPACLIARGPNLAPGLFTTPMSIGAPMIATSGFMDWSSF